MENASMAGAAEEEEYMELPPGFRFHPSDEELVTYYLSEKVRDSRFSARAIGEVDLNKCEPWDLPRRAKMGEKEWYFFCLKDRKYPTGFRTNRATDAGYWKATGKDKEIYRAKSLVGMKKTLVFYRGRAPKGTKTNWVVHEYRVEGNYSVSTVPKTVKNEWVICRVFEKSSGGKKVIVHRPYDTGLPPLRDSSPSRSKQKRSSNMSHHVTCFSSGRADDPGTEEEEMMEMLQSSLLSCSPPTTSSDMSPASALFHRSSYPSMGNHFQQHPEEGLMMVQENSVLRMLLEGQAEKVKRDSSSRAELSQGSSVSNPEMIQGGFDDQEHVGPVDLQCLWSY